jgi:hypothetical protein
MQVLSLSYNRPFHLWLTQRSLRLSLLAGYLPASQIIIFDQNSGNVTKLILNRLSKLGCQVINSNLNVGMLEGWSRLVANSDSEFLLLLKNDWFCNSSDSRWMQDAVAILEKSPDVSFVKLRRLDDIDNYGKGLVDHQPCCLGY